MNNLGFDLGKFQGDNTMFIVQLCDISQELAANVIYDVDHWKDLKNVTCQYYGNHKSGSAEFIIKNVNPNPIDYLSPASISYYRHLITMLCAGISTYINKHITVVEKTEEFRSWIFDNMFPLQWFECISARLRMIEHLKAESCDFVKGAKCSCCPFSHRGIEKCVIHDSSSEQLNRILGYLSFDDFNQMVFISRTNKPAFGNLACRCNNFGNLNGWLDLEQFLDTTDLF